MQGQFLVADVKAALSQRLYPTITSWNRLEGRPRRDDFSRALKVEVRDPLWLLAKQWQVGEFTAEDAGSPAVAKIHINTSPMTRYRPAEGAAEPYSSALPLECRAERRAIAWTVDDKKMQLALRAQLGRQWRRMLVNAGLAAYPDKFRKAYPFTLPVRDEASDQVYAHREGWQHYAALASRAIDGGDLHLHLTGTPPNHASDGIALDDPADAGKLDQLGSDLETWFATLYAQPERDDTWKPPYLEHQFECAGPQQGSELALSAAGYPGGHLDWYAFDRAPAGEALGGAGDPGEKLITTSFLPAPVTFEGMPDVRWWALEDRKTDFGNVKPSTTDLPHLLLMEFALVYANDWFLFPCKLLLGTAARIAGLAVTDNFGGRFWIRPAGTGSQDNWHRWGMFQLSGTAPGERPADGTLFLPPVVAKTMDGSLLEEVELARDEVANMVWAVERVVPSVTGEGRMGKDEARETRAYHQSLVQEAGPVPADYQAGIAYLAMTSVPEHWIPLVPVHVPGSVRRIQLQRSRMLRIIRGDPAPPAKVPPRTAIMREGLDRPVKAPYFLHEEEVPRAGIRVSQSFRRTRWTGGQACVWLAAQKHIDRGEKGSGLAFDSIVDSKPRGKDGQQG